MSVTWICIDTSVEVKILYAKEQDRGVYVTLQVLTFTTHLGIKLNRFRA